MSMTALLPHSQYNRASTVQAPVFERYYARRELSPIGISLRSLTHAQLVNDAARRRLLLPDTASFNTQRTQATGAIVTWFVESVTMKLFANVNSERDRTKYFASVTMMHNLHIFQGTVHNS